MIGPGTPADLLQRRNTHAVLHGRPALSAVNRLNLVRILHRNIRII
jgi:hypothetical protein